MSWSQQNSSCVKLLYFDTISKYLASNHLPDNKQSNYTIIRYLVDNLSNRRNLSQKRIVKFVPTKKQRQLKVKEWQKVTPELSALLESLDDKDAAKLSTRYLIIV